MPTTPYLTQSSYSLLSGLSVVPTGFSNAYIDSIFLDWSEQIDRYCNTSFELIVGEKRQYNVPNCSATIVYIGSWQKTPSLVIKKVSKENQSTQLLIENVDFEYKYSKDNKCIVALDFGCKGCLCECEK
jgi:hypothetical protein